MRPTLAKILNNARKSTISFCRGISFSLSWILIYCAVLSSLFAATAPIQSTAFGVLILVLALYSIVLILYAINEKSNEYSDSGVFEDPLLANKKLALVLVVAIPIGISWAMNESLYGALSPIGYWSEELTGINENDCSFAQDMLNRSAEEFRVTQNKFDMGIATVFEVERAAEALKVAQGLRSGCSTATEKRRTEILKRLSELRKK